MVEATKEAISNIVKQVLEIDDDIKDEDDLLSYGLTSMSVVRLIVELEESFGFTFDDNDFAADNFLTIGSIYQLLNFRSKNY